MRETCISVKDFGAVGDAVADDTQAFLSAIAYVGTLPFSGTIYIPAGTYMVNSTLTISGPISIRGDGLFLSEIRWNGAAGGTVLAQTGFIFGTVWSGFRVNANSIAARAVDLDRMQNCYFGNLSFIRATETCLYLAPRALSAGQNFMWNVLENIQLGLAGIPGLVGARGLYLGSAGPGSNCCHNSFVNINSTCSGTSIYLSDCDNNSFNSIYCFTRPEAPVGTFAIELAGGSLTRSNYFVHVQGQIHATSGSRNSVLFYDRENGQPRPVVDSGADLDWTETNANSLATQTTSPFGGISLYINDTNATPSVNAKPEIQAFKMYKPSNGQFFGLTLDSSGSRMAKLWSTNDGSGPYQVMAFGNNSVGFLGASPVGRPAVTGSRGGNAAVASLLTALANLGLITDSSSA